MQEMLNTLIEKKGNDYVTKRLNFILKYCWFTGSIEGIEEYLDTYCKIDESSTVTSTITSTMDQLNYIIKILSKKLNTNNELDILRYIYENSGFVVHSTRESIYESMRETGLNGDNKPFDMEELIELDNLFKNKYHDSHGILGWLMIDKKCDKHNCWFYDKTAAHAIYYSNGPEWFSQFCGGSYADTPEEMQALKFGDKECARNNIIKYCTRLNFTLEDLDYVLTIFEKYWEKYATSKQVMVLVSRKEVDEFVPFDEIIKSYTNNGIIDIEEIKKKIFYKTFIEDINDNSDIVIPFDKLTKLDISMLCPKKKIKSTPLRQNDMQVEQQNVKEYKYFKLVCDILSNFLTQYATTIQDNISSLEYNNMDSAIKFKDNLLMIANNLENNIIFNVKETENPRSILKSTIDQLFEYLFINMDMLTEVLYYAYNYIFRYDDIMNEIKYSKFFNTECKYNEDFIFECYIEEINSNIKLDNNNCTHFNASYKDNKYIHSKCSINYQSLAHIIKDYQEQNNISNDELKMIFVELYYMFSKIMHTLSNDSLREFHDEMRELRKQR